VLDRLAPVPNQKRARQKAARAKKLEEHRRLQKRHQVLRRVVLVIVVAGIVLATALAFISTAQSPKTSTTTTPTTFPPTTTTPYTSPASVKADGLRANRLAVAAGCPADPYKRVNTLHWSKAPKMTIDASKTYYATFDTTAGTFVVALNATEAPVTVNNFVFLAEHNFYSCVIFQRVIPGFVVQGGDPTGTGSGVLGYTIPDEFPSSAGNPTYPLYTIAMANEGTSAGPNTGSDQFFIVTGADGETLPPDYTKFGVVIDGLNVPITIQNLGTAKGTPRVIERMLKVTISTVAP
jgi:cyclophilin family peptidyl-prolyl cis-trans isomerase